MLCSTQNLNLFCGDRGHFQEWWTEGRQFREQRWHLDRFVEFYTSTAPRCVHTLTELPLYSFGAAQEVLFNEFWDRLENAGYDVILDKQSQLGVCVPREKGRILWHERIWHDDSSGVLVGKHVKNALHTRILYEETEVSIFVFHMPGGLDNAPWCVMARDFLGKCMKARR